MSPANATNPNLKKTIKLTGTVVAGLGDDNSADNTAILSIDVPAADKLPTDTAAHVLPCNGG